MSPGKPLVSNHKHVMQILQSAKGPMTAYEILDAVRRKGISAPPTVYRALTRLLEEGLVHRLESINAYVACSDDEHDHGPVAFAICSDCGNVDEIEEGPLVRRLKADAARTGFKVEATTIELKGKCASCVAA